MWRMIVLDWVSPSYLLFRPIINWNNTQCGVLFQVRVSDDVFQTFVCRQYYQHTTPYPHTFRHFEFLKALVKYLNFVVHDQIKTGNEYRYIG